MKVYKSCRKRKCKNKKWKHKSFKSKDKILSYVKNENVKPRNESL